MLDKCIIHGYGYLGSRIVGLIEGTRQVQADWKPANDLPFGVSAIVERDTARRMLAQAHHQAIPCFDRIETALEFAGGPTTFIKDFTSPIGRTRLLDIAGRAGVPVLLEKPLSAPGIEVSLAGREELASVNMSEVFNPVVRTVANKLAHDMARINSMAFVRINSLTLQRLEAPRYRRDIIGGAFVDKLVHDLHLLVSGALLGPANVDFGPPQIHQIAFDLVTGENYVGPSFASLDGAPLSPTAAAELSAGPSEMLVDLTIPIRLGGHPLPTRWIASWCGMPSDLATRVGISDEHVEAARLTSGGDPNAVGPAAYRHSNLKLIVCEYTTQSGDDVQLICNIQARGHVRAWIVERRNGNEYRHTVPYYVPIIESMRMFSQEFRTGTYLNVADILRADRVALDIRSKFRKPQAEELQIKRSLAILDHYNGRSALATTL